MGKITSCLIIIAIGILAYSNTFQVPFSFDDASNIAENPIIKDLQYFAEPSNAKGFPLYNTFRNRFIGYFTFALNYRMHGLDVRGYHIVNLAIHVLNALLVYWLVVFTFRTPWFSVIARSETTRQSPPSEIASSRNTGTRNDNGVLFQPSSLNLHPSLIALFSALIFVSHPVQTQAVTYIVQRFTSLATLFYLMSLVMYVKFRTQKPEYRSQNESVIAIPTIRDENQGDEAIPKGEIASPPVRNDLTSNSKPCLPAGRLLTCQKTGRQALTPIFWYLGSVFSAVLAMKTKEIAFTLPIIIALYEFSFFTKTFNLPKNRQAGFKLLTFNFKRFLYLLPFLLTLLIIPLSYIGADTSAGDLLSDVSETARLQTDMSRLDYLFTELRVIVTYIRLLFFPINQNLDYDYPVYNSFLNPNVFLSFLFLLAILGLGVYLFYYSRQQHSQAKACGYLQLETRCGSPLRVAPTCSLKLISFGIFWFFITLSVESSVIPIVDVIFEHRVYLPSIGAIIATITGVTLLLRILQGKKIYIITISILILICTLCAAYKRNSVWESGISLWRDTVKKSPLLSRPHIHLGQALAEKGLWNEAELHFTEARRLGKAAELSQHKNMGLLKFDREGILDFQIVKAKRGIENNPSDKSFANLGFLYLTKGEYAEALEQFKKALGLNNSYCEAYIGIATVYTNKGLIEEAILEYKNAIAHSPDCFNANIKLGVLYATRTGRTDLAIAEFKRAIDINPASFEAHNNLGVAYDELGQLDKAVAEYQYAINLSPDNADAHYNLGVVYKKMALNDKANEEFKRTLEINSNYHNARIQLDNLSSVQ